MSDGLESRPQRPRLRVALLMLLPFALYWWCLPLPGSTTLMWDYPFFTPDAQVYLVRSVARGILPMFIPGFAVTGQAAAAATLGQIYHPMTLLSALVPGYWSGHALQIVTVLKCLEIGLAHVVLDRWFRRLEVKPMVAFIVSFGAIYNFRVIDSFRYNASLENFAGLIFLTAALGGLALGPSTPLKRSAVAISTYLLLVGGHPQWAYLCMLSAGVITLVMPAYTAAMTGTPWTWKATRAFLMEAGAFILLGCGLAAIYAIPFYFDYVKQNGARAFQTYDFTTTWEPQSILAAVSGLFHPWLSDMHWGFEGPFTLWIAVLVIPILAAYRIRIPKVILALWGISFIALLGSLGTATPVHRLLYAVIPMFGSFRGPGRLLIGVIAPLAMVGAWALGPRGPMIARRRRAIVATIVLGGVVGFFAIRHSGVWRHPSEWAPVVLTRPSRAMHGVAFALGAAVLGLFAWSFATSRPAHRTWSLAAGAALNVARVTLLFSYGLQMGAPWPVRPDPKNTDTSRSVGDAGVGMEPGVVTSSRVHVDDDLREAWFASRPHVVATLDEAFHKGAYRRWPMEGVVVDPGDSNGRVPLGCVDPGAETRTRACFRTQDRLMFTFKSGCDRYFITGYPRIKGWTFLIDGIPTPLLAANGSGMAARIPAGQHVLDLRFWSWPAAAGAIVTVLSAILLGFAAAWGGMRRAWWARGLWIGAAVIVGAAWVYLTFGPARWVPETACRISTPSATHP